jgi:hypothetical protein
MVKEMLSESSFEARPAHSVPGPAAKASAKIACRLRKDG